MKAHPAANPLCLSCRRTCKQPATVLIAVCPRYYAGPKVKHCNWKQLELPLSATAHEPPIIPPDQP